MAFWRCDVCGKIEQWGSTWGQWGTADEAAFVCCSDACSQVSKPFFSRVRMEKPEASGHWMNIDSVNTARLALQSHTGVSIGARPESGSSSWVVLKK